MYDLLTVPLATLYAATGPAVENGAIATNVPLYTAAVALAIDERSQLPDCLVWFDGEPTAYPLVRGAVIRRSFARLRVAPLLPASYPAAVALPGASVPTSLHPAAGSLVLRAWRIADVVEAGNAPSMIDVTQQQIKLAAGNAITRTIGFARIAGARQVTCWASNDNKANTAAATLQLFTVRPQVVGQGTVRTTLATGTLLGSATLPAAADGGNRVEVSIWYPGTWEVAWKLATAQAGTYWCSSGVEITYAQP